MRAEVIRALRAVGDPAHQKAVWLNPDRIEDLMLNVSVLFDDSLVLPDPQAHVGVVGSVVLPDEVQILQELGSAFGALIDRLGDRPDKEYLNDPSWPLIVLAAQRAGALLAGSE